MIGVACPRCALRIELPASGRRLCRGPASLTFVGRATFVGTVRANDAGCELLVERSLPVLPIMADVKQLWDPDSDTRDRLMARLTRELERRRQPMPVMPQELPAPTPWSHLRAARRGVTPPAH